MFLQSYGKLQKYRQVFSGICRLVTRIAISESSVGKPNDQT